MASAPSMQPASPAPGSAPGGGLRDALAGVADPLALLEGLLAHSPVPYSVFAADGRCLLTNPAFHRVFGVTLPPTYNVLEDASLELLGLSALVRRAFEGEAVETPVFWYDPMKLRASATPEERRVAISCSFFPVLAEGGQVRHVVIAGQDRTAEWLHRDAEQERLQLVLKTGGLGLWELDLRTLRLECSEGCKRNFGLQPGEDLSSYERLRSLIHPEDRPAMEAAVERAISQREDYAAEYRVPAPEGEGRWVVARGRVECAQDGTPVMMRGITLDITQVKRSEQEREQLLSALAAERARLRAVLDHIPAGVLLAEAPSGRIVLGNAQLEFLLRHPVLPSPSVEHYGEWVGFHADGRRVEAREWPLARALQGETVAGDDFLYQRGDGTREWIRVSGAPIRHDGHITGSVVAIYDIQEERRAQGRLRALADTSTVLAQTSVDFNEALEQLARLASETLGECCVLTLLNEDEQTLDVVATYHPSPEARQLLKESLREGYDNARGAAMQVVRTGRPVLVAHVPQEGLLESMAPQARPFTERYGVHSLLIVPMRVQGMVIGTMGVSRGQPGWAYTQEDQTFLQEMADRAGLVIQNVRLLRTAQQAVRLRDDFLSIASHELKTPLTPLSLKLQVMARLLGAEPGEALAPRLLRDVEIMRRQVKRLSDLINDLLDVARISGGRLKLVPEEVELSSLVHEVVSRFELEAERAGGRLNVRATTPFTGHWDRLRLEQVVTNLLSNALKYGPGKPIHVTLETDGDAAWLRVRDEGIGIEPQHLARIFQKFERAVSERHYGGLGLGLYISLQILEAMGGSIAVDSVPGQGTVFTVRLPLRSPAEPA